MHALEVSLLALALRQFNPHPTPLLRSLFSPFLGFLALQTEMAPHFFLPFIAFLFILSPNFIAPNLVMFFGSRGGFLNSMVIMATYLLFDLLLSRFPFKPAPNATPTDKIFQRLFILGVLGQTLHPLYLNIR